MERKSSSRKRRKKAGKYAPLIWVLTGAAIAFFVAYSGTIKENFFDNLLKPTNSIHSGTSSSSSSKSADNEAGNLIQNIIDNTLKANASSSQFAQSVSSSSVSAVTVKIYLAEHAGDSVILVEQSVKVSSKDNVLLNTLEMLIQNRSNPNLLNLIPLNTKIRKVWEKSGVAYIDFSEDFSYNTYGTVGYNIQIYQIVYTVTQFSNYKAVYFYMNGRPLEYLGGDGYIIHNPVFPFSTLPKFSL